MSAPVASIAIRGIRQSIPNGHVLGRISQGSGDVEVIPLASLGFSMTPVLTQTVGPVQIKTAGAGITNTNGTLSVEWNGGTVGALGTGLSINSGTLSPNWRAGTVTALGTNLSITSGTLNASSTLTAAQFAALDLSTLPTSNPGSGKPWLNGGVVQVGA